MRFLFAVILAASLSLAAAYGQEASKAEHQDPIPTSFKEAYKGYNQAIKDNKRHITTHYAQRAYEFGLEKFGAEHTNTLNLTLNWINAYNSHSHDHELPEELLVESLPKYEKAAQKNPASLLDTYLTYGSYYLVSNKRSGTKKALKYFESAIETTEKYFKENEASVAVIKLEIARKLYQQSSNRHVKKYLDDAKTIFSQDPVKNNTNLAITNFWLGKVHMTANRNRNAAKAMSLALKTFDEIDPSGSYAMMGHAFMIKILEKQGKREEATKHCQKIGKAQAFDVNKEPTPLYRQVPLYPRGAQQRRQNGYVIIEFSIDEEGYVKNAKPIDFSGSEAFSKSALEVMEKFRYAPRFENGKPVSTDAMKTRFIFQMDK